MSSSYISNLPPANATTKPGAQKYNQVVNTSHNNYNKTVDNSVKPFNTCAKIIQNHKQEIGTISPSLDLNLKIESCKKVWDITGKNKQHKGIHSNEIIDQTCEKPNISEPEKPSLTETVIKDVLEPLMNQKSPVPPLINNFYDKNLLKPSNGVFTAFNSEPTQRSVIV